MKYLIFGMGGVGASVAARLTQHGKHLDVIARGSHLEALQNEGLYVKRSYAEDIHVKDFHATCTEDYQGNPDVIFICVKGYSLESCYPLLLRCCSQKTLVIPLLNIYGTGQKINQYLQRELGCNAPLCADGCIYVSAELEGAGILLERGPKCRVVFGLPDQKEQPASLHTVAADVASAGIDCILSEDIRRDALKKFTYVSPMGATAILCQSNAGDVSAKPSVRSTFTQAIQEIVSIGEAMGITFGEDMITTNIGIAEGLNPASTTSMQRDLESGRPSEFDGLINEVIRLGEKYQVDTPTYLRAKEQALKRFGVS